MENIRTFEYRPARKEAGFRVDFVSESGDYHGICKNVSANGVRVEFDGFLETGISGLLLIHHPVQPIEIEARVTHVDKCDVGLIFVFQSNWEREKLTAFIRSLEGHAAGIPFLPSE